MKTKDLLVSNLNISEDEYDYKAIFTLTGEGKSITIEISDLESREKVLEIAILFGLEESTVEVSKLITDMVIRKADISSKIKEGEDYQESNARKNFERLARSLDIL